MSADQVTWTPFCGTEFGVCPGGGQAVGTVADWPAIAESVVAGDPVVCDVTHEPGTRHHNTALGFTWL